MEQNTGNGMEAGVMLGLCRGLEELQVGYHYIETTCSLYSGHVLKFVNGIPDDH